MKRAVAGLAGLCVMLWSVSASAQIAKLQKEVEEHIKTLKTAKEAQQRAQAIQDLQEIGEQKLDLLRPAIPALVEALKDPDANVRRLAVGTLSDLKPDAKTALANLIANLADTEDRDVKLYAVLTIIPMGKAGRPALPALEGLLKKEMDKPEGMKDGEMLQAVSQAVGALQLTQVTLGPWRYIGPFDNSEGKGFAAVYFPEKTIDFKREYFGKGGATVTWRDGRFTDGEVNSLALFKEADNVHSVVYLHRTIECEKALNVEVSLGSDDTLTVWLNGEKLVSENAARTAAADQNKAVLKLKPGKNDFLMKVCQGDGDWAFYFNAVKVVP